MLKTIRKHGITLALFAAGSTGLTAAINLMTKSTIDEQATIQQKALFDQVLPADRYNNQLQNRHHDSSDSEGSELNNTNQTVKNDEAVKSFNVRIKWAEESNIPLHNVLVLQRL